MSWTERDCSLCRSPKQTLASVSLADRIAKEAFPAAGLKEDKRNVEKKSMSSEERMCAHHFSINKGSWEV